MGGTFNLGKLFGIQFRLHFSWFVIFILITASLSLQLFPAGYPDWPAALYWVIGLITSLLFFASVVVHELAHSLVGRANGISIGSITLFIFGGVAQMTREATNANAEFKMAFAGPLSSLVLGGFFGLLWFLFEGVVEPLAAISFWLAYVNVALAAFNLIPGFPLDGGRVFRSILWYFSGNYSRSSRIATRVGQGIGYLFILGGILIIFLHPFDLTWFDGIWIAFIGWFLESAASASYRQVRWEEALSKIATAEMLPADYPTASSDSNLN